MNCLQVATILMGVAGLATLALGAYRLDPNAISCTKNGCTGPCKNFEKYFKEGSWYNYDFAAYGCHTKKLLAVIGFDNLEEEYKDMRDLYKKYEKLYSNQYYDIYDNAHLDAHNENAERVQDEDKSRAISNIARLVERHDIVDSAMVSQVDILYSTLLTKIQYLIRKCPHVAIQIDWLKEDLEFDCNANLDSVSNDAMNLSSQMAVLATTLNSKLILDEVEKLHRKEASEIHSD